MLIPGRCERKMNGTVPLENRQVPKKLNIHLPYITIPLLDIFKKNENLSSQKKTYTRMYIVAILIMAPNWKEPKSQEN